MSTWAPGGALDLHTWLTAREGDRVCLYIGAAQVMGVVYRVWPEGSVTLGNPLRDNATIPLGVVTEARDAHMHLAVAS